MAKVFATLLEGNKVVLKIWPSAVQFAKAESWTDDKFIYIATSKDFKGDWSVSASFDCDLEPETEKPPQKVGFRMAYSEQERKAHALMCEARRNYLKI